MGNYYLNLVLFGSETDPKEKKHPDRTKMLWKTKNICPPQFSKKNKNAFSDEKKKQNKNI